MALLLPLSFFVIAKWLGKDKIRLPRYYRSTGMDTVKDSKGKKVLDSLYYHTATLRAINQLGDTIDLNRDLAGKMLVVNFFFTTCPTICPKLTQNMRLLQNAYRRTAMKQNDEIVQFISITVNPERDSPAVLRAYADRYGANHDRWWFLTGDKAALYRYAREELRVSDPAGDGGADDFVHTEKFVLLDSARHIRGYYNGLDSLDVGRCSDDIGLLYMEKHIRQ